MGQPAYRYQVEVKQLSLPMRDYIKGVTSKELSWLTCLRTSPKEISMNDILDISKISNLAVLDLSDGQTRVTSTVSSFNERVMRALGELARTDGAFRHLRVLLLGWQEHVDSWIFKYLHHFPSLCCVVMTDCAKIHQKNRADWEDIAEEHGWEARHAKRSAKSLKPVLDDKSFYLGAVSGMYYHVEDNFASLKHPNRPAEVKRRPVLECWLGTPRLWTHIVDDFPGPRTVWFDRKRVVMNHSINWLEGSSKLIEHEQIKRARDVSQTSQESRSPPPKRSQGKGQLRNKPAAPTATDLLRQFGF